MWRRSSTNQSGQKSDQTDNYDECETVSGELKPSQRGKTSLIENIKSKTQRCRSTNNDQQGVTSGRSKPFLKFFESRHAIFLPAIVLSIGWCLLSLVKISEFRDLLKNEAPECMKSNPNRELVFVATLLGLILTHGPLERAAKVVFNESRTILCE